jgi:uncharacterized membrane protein HdeD (DUF308 family)
LAVIGKFDSRFSPKLNLHRPKSRLLIDGDSADWCGIWRWKISESTINHRRRADQMSIRWRGQNRPVRQNADEQTDEPKRRIGRFLKSIFFGRRWVIGGVIRIGEFIAARLFFTAHPMLTLKQTFGFVTLLAAIMACIVSALQPPSSITNLPRGLLFALTLGLCSVAIARIISAFPQINRFWTGFLSVCTICFAISFSTPIMSANTAPEHLARFIVRLHPLDSNIREQGTNERFYAVKGTVTNAAVLMLAFACGVMAQQRPTARGEPEKYG